MNNYLECLYYKTKEKKIFIAFLFLVIINQHLRIGRLLGNIKIIIIKKTKLLLWLVFL